MINKIKAIKRCMLPCVLSATLASTIVTPVNAQQNETYNPVRDLQFTSELNTDESHISTASEESVELKSDVKYNEDKSSATMTITAPEGYVLSLSDDWKASYKTFLDDGTIAVQNENTNSINVTTNYKNIYRLEVNVKDKDNTLTTQNIDFQALDIISVQSDVQQEEETNVADSPAGEVNSRTVNSSVQTSHDSKSLGVSYTGTDSYVWSIPSEINLNNQDTLTVSATKANEEANASLKIAVSSENGFNMKSDTGRTGAYKITKDGNQITNNSTILETTSSGTSTTDLKFTANPANFMTAEKYNDTLTFKAQNGYTTGTVLEVGDYKLIVINQKESDKYLVISTTSIGDIVYNSKNQNTQKGNNTYENSEIDNFLEKKWYNDLPLKMKEAIQLVEIKQVSYPTCDDITNVKENGYGDEKYNTISRHVYLPSVVDFNELIDLKDSTKVKKYLNGNTAWTRDSSFRNITEVVYLSSAIGALNCIESFYPQGTYPAFVIDLSKINYTVTGTVNYK
ncbi:DUF6273 domain-containing protein [Holdemanella porci]|uniref:DUF6273 domain-containing protein n=1 Tax=Holdemanella porci TaxID=2652276 RepID=UPI003AF0DF4E